VQARLLKQLVAQAPTGGASEITSRGAACVKFAVEAAGSGATAEASEVLDAAGKSLARLIVPVQAAKRAAKAAAARAREPAEKAEYQKKAAAADAELEAIKSAQLAVSDCARALQKALREREVIQAARVRLKTSPDDPQSCLTVGRWYCFQQGNWDEGLKLLAKGSDPDLKSLAAEELASKPGTDEQRVARGDAWWNLAEKAAGKAKEAMRRRAGQWYQEALPDIAPGLTRAKVEKRLAEAAAAPVTETAGQSAGVRPPLVVAPFDEETAKKHQARWARYLRLPVVSTNSIGMKLVVVPPGEFQMGSPKEQIDDELRTYAGDALYNRENCLQGEGPQHRVRISKPYWLGATHVTQDEYQRVMGVNPSKYLGDPQRPVEQVFWFEAEEFCRKLSELPAEKAAKRQYALPSEAQWEYACRAGTTTRWYTGGDEAGFLDAAWITLNALHQPHTVAQKKPNAWGLYDMHGNVWQWCQDFYDVGYYANSPTDDPTGPSAGSYHVYRGGSCFFSAKFCRSAYRYFDKPTLRSNDIGFRVVATLPEKPGK
jgi:formylglycine-generating enzyme required for sulfatase activity